jgi:single-stranded-DNA-specific exonuclease
VRATVRAWHLMPQDVGEVERLAAAVRVSPIVAQLLINRGVRDAVHAQRFLATPFKGLHEPGLLPGVSAAADRLHQAIQKGERVCVYGDYDVDGLTGTAILWQALRFLGGNADFYVPHRLDEGYGLNTDALSRIAQDGCSVVVTVDCGIASVREALDARRLGLELLITDHHEFHSTLPDASVVVHPRLPGTDYPFGELSGSGVALKLAWALCQRASGSQRVSPQMREFLLDSVTLAALGMVADCVSLLDENRIVVRHGIERLRHTGSVGLRALLEAAGLNGKSQLSALDIAFGLAPRINAAGRLGCARLVVELLTTNSQARATELARHLEVRNSERQQIERRILHEAHEALEGSDLDSAPALVLASPTWHAGVIGIVAGRLAEVYSRPVLLIALRESGELGQGSGRSVPGFHLHEALEACADGLVSHGGHAAAAGFKIPASMVDEFRDRFCAYASKAFQSGPEAARLEIDTELPLAALTPGLVEAVGHLEPYGAGNPRPRLLAGPVKIVGTPRRVGKGERHLQFQVRQQETTLRTIGFNFGDRADELMSAGGECCIVFTPSFNEWQGWRSVQLEIVDFQAGPRARFGSQAQPAAPSLSVPG